MDTSVATPMVNLDEIFSLALSGLSLMVGRPPVIGEIPGDVLTGSSLSHSGISRVLLPDAVLPLLIVASVDRPREFAADRPVTA